MLEISIRFYSGIEIVKGLELGMKSDDDSVFEDESF